MDGERFEQTFSGQTFIDPGLTVDAVLAFAAAGVSGDNADKAIAWLNKPEVTANYDGDFDDDPTKGFSAGSLAKLILAAEVMGKDPHAFGGVDLVALLLPLQQPSGRFVDSSSFGDFVNALGQSFAVIALHRTGDHDAEATKAAQYLLSVECSDGGFPLNFPTAPGDPCDSQIDATALVVQALLAAGQTDAAKDGLDWLVSKQKASGGFDDDAASNPLPVNANSTGVAAEALRVGGRTEAADKAVAFLLAQQIGCGATAANRGAIAYDSTGFNASTATRATTQAVLGLAGVGLVDLNIKGAATAAPTLTCAAPTATPKPTISGAGGLPVTGQSLTPVLIGGVALIVVGAGVLLLLRRRRNVTEF